MKSGVVPTPNSQLQEANDLHGRLKPSYTLTPCPPLPLRRGSSGAAINAKCKMQNAKSGTFCILHFAFRNPLPD
jgi:hypothetical protein